MYKFRRKTYRTYEDFIHSSDLIDPNELKPLNLSITDFDASGQVANPRAPCVVTTIDPDYIKDASRQRICKKFRMKTDILRLREITRNKFMYYGTQEMYFDRKREIEVQNRVYEEALEFHKFADESLKKMEADAFREMLQAQKKLIKLKENKVAEELNEVKLEHQRVLMEVQEVYGRFKYLLKLISYFDDTIEQPDNAVQLTMPIEILGLEISEKNPAGLKEVDQVSLYMEKVVRPYLAKRNHLSAEVWIKGYERNRMKVSNYNRRFTHLALLNHIVGIVHDKAQKTYKRQTLKFIFLKDPEFLRSRVLDLRRRAEKLFTAFECKYIKDKVSIKLNSILPVILKDFQREDKIQAKSTELSSDKPIKQWRTLEDVQKETDAKATVFGDEQETTLVKVQKIQAYVLELLSKLDNVPQSELFAIESRVRQRLKQERDMSRRALVKQNRLNNLLEHFKKHHNLQQQQRLTHQN